MLKKKTVKVLGRILLVLLWLGTLVVTVIWAFDIRVPFDPEPVTVLLGLISMAVTAIITEYASLLRFEEYTAPYALAYGYVNNFIEPVVTRLLDVAAPEEEVEFYIYIPDKLSELYKPSVERTMARVRKAGFQSEVINLDLEAGRARDVMTVFRDGSNDIKYFDFPNTLLTLVSLVDYKVESKGDSFDEKEKEEQGRKHIEAFEEAVRELVKKKRIEEHVFFTDSSLDFLNNNLSA